MIKIVPKQSLSCQIKWKRVSQHTHVRNYISSLNNIPIAYSIAAAAGRISQNKGAIKLIEVGSTSIITWERVEKYFVILSLLLLLLCICCSGFYTSGGDCTLVAIPQPSLYQKVIYLVVLFCSFLIAATSVRIILLYTQHRKLCTERNITQSFSLHQWVRHFDRNIKIQLHTWMHFRRNHE